MVFTVLQLGAGNKAAQTLQVAGHAAAVETADLHLNNFPFFFELLHLVPALAQGQRTAADRDHAIRILFAGDQHLHFQSLGEALLQVGDHPEPAFTFGHESGRFTSDVHVDTVAFHPDHDPGDHFSGGTDRFVLIECREEGILIEIEIIHAAAGGTSSRLLLAGTTASALVCGAQKVCHGQPFKFGAVEAAVVL